MVDLDGWLAKWRSSQVVLLRDKALPTKSHGPDAKLKSERSWQRSIFPVALALVGYRQQRLD